MTENVRLQRWGKMFEDFPGLFSRECGDDFRRLNRMGILTLDAEPRQVGTQLVNRYLEIKRRELL